MKVGGSNEVVKPLKTKMLHLRLSEAEHARFLAAIAPLGHSQSEALRRFVRATAGLGPTFDDDIRSSILTMVRQMRGIGVNINQVARLMNSGRVPPDGALQQSFGLLLQLLVDQETLYLALCGKAGRRARYILEGTTE